MLPIRKFRSERVYKAERKRERRGGASGIVYRETRCAGWYEETRLDQNLVQGWLVKM